MAATYALPWNSLPTEMKFSVVEHLHDEDIRAFAKVNKEAYSLAVPALWRVRLHRSISPHNNLISSTGSGARQSQRCAVLSQQRPAFLPSLHSQAHHIDNANSIRIARLGRCLGCFGTTPWQLPTDTAADIEPRRLFGQERHPSIPNLP